MKNLHVSDSIEAGLQVLLDKETGQTRKYVCSSQTIIDQCGLKKDLLLHHEMAFKGLDVQIVGSLLISGSSSNGSVWCYINTLLYSLIMTREGAFTPVVRFTSSIPKQKNLF